MTPQQRDRWMQVSLAQARGPVRNGDLLRQAIDRALQIRAQRDQMRGAVLMDDALIETLTELVGAMEDLKITYAVTGSVASSIHGEPFQSLDAELVVLASARQAAGLSGRLTPRFYAPEDMLLDAAERHAFTNVVDNRTSLKVDLSFVGDDLFLQQVLRRRIRGRIGSHPRGVLVRYAGGCHPDEAALEEGDPVGQAVGEHAGCRPREGRENGLEIPICAGQDAWHRE